MFCCTLVALVFSQPALAFGAIKARLLGSQAAFALPDTTRQWRHLMIFGLIGLDAILLVCGVHFLGGVALSANPLATFAHICGLSR
jgi:hypothetical protein